MRPVDLPQALTLITLLTAAYGVVMTTMALVMGWQWFRDRVPIRFRRGGGRVPRVDAIGLGTGVVG